MKKLIPAFALLLISAIVLSTSSYAWFTMNSTVSASGMQVKASAGTGLVISLWDNDAKSGAGSDAKGWTIPAASVNASEWNTERAVDTIEPTSTINAIDWYTAVAEKESESDAKGDVYTASTAFTNKYASTLYYYDKLEVKTNDGNSISDKSLVITSIEVNDGTDASHAAKSGDLNKALRVALVVTCNSTTTTYFFAPSYTDYPDVNGVKKASGTGYEAVKMSTVDAIKNNLYAGTDQITLSENTIYGSTTVEMYVYYDGEDENCFTNNTLAGLDELSVSINFKAAETTT